MTKYLDNEGLTHFTRKMKEYADGKAGEVDSKVTTHVGNKQNPHGVTKAQVGLSSVDNVQQIPLSQRGAANGVATLDANGKVPVEQMPDTKTINGASIFGSGNLQLSTSLYKIVDTLPTTDIDISKIYLVPASATTAKNNKTEYIYLGDPNKAYDESKWEKLGDEQKSSTVTTPGGSITVDTALIENSPNPIAGGVVKAKIDEIDTKLAKKVESSDYTTKMTAIDSKLKTLENKTIDVDAELKDSPNPVQNRAVNKAVNDLNDVISKKADTTALNSALGRITALENNDATGVTVIESGEGNGIASIKNVGKNIIATKATFVTSLTGYVTTDTLNTELAKKSDVEHTHTQYAETSALDNYALKSALDRKVDAVVGKGLSTEDFTSAEKTKLGGIAEGATRVIVDDTINDSINAIQNSAVKKAVDDLNTAIGKKANSTDLNAATGKITTLETNAATILSVTGEGNGISSISKSGNTITATKGNFLTSAAGLATTAALNDGLAGKADVNHNHDTKYAAKEHTHPEYAQSSALNDYVTKTALDGKNFLTATSLNGYVNEVQPDGTQSGNGIANITKEGKVLKVTKATFLTEHQSLAGYATQTWVNEQGFATGTIPTKISELNNDSGFLTQQSLNGYWNQLYVDERDGNGIADIWVDIHNKSELCVSKRRFVTPETLGTSIDDYVSSKGYLTENNLNEKLKETVTIKLVSDKSASDTNLNGAKVTVKSGDTTVSTQTWQGTPIEVKVPCDKEVTIEVATVKMYIKPKVLKYVPSPLYNREVTFTYKALELGVFIVDKNDKTYKTAKEFTDSGIDIKDVIGTLLVTDNAAIVVANYNSEYVSWGPKVLVDGCTVANDTTTAVQDFAGAANTAAIMKVVGSASTKTAASICYNYIFGNGRRGHLMSAGEGAVIQRMYNNIRRLMSQIGIDDSSVVAPDKNYWTSTQISASKVYRYRFYESTPSDDIKDNVNYVIPIYSLYD